jgi:hydrogenase-4 membrane subunit HyfE
MINIYRYQSSLLCVLVLVAAWLEGRIIELTLVSFIPLSLVIFIEPILARATVSVPQDAYRQLLHYWFRDLPSFARPIWLRSGTSRLPAIARPATITTLTLVAYVLAFNVVRNPNPSYNNNIAVSLSLLLIGLFVAGNKEDLIAQIIGLLVMEHGLFLAAVKIITIAWIFVVSLFVYILLTLFILVVLLPELHQVSGSLEVDRQKTLRG